MILNVLVVLLVIAITLLWGIRGKGRGLFSSMLATVCVIVSGAVAFALWEPLVYNVLLDVNEDMAWGLGLIIPFAGALLVTRLLTELLVPKNLDFGDVENFVGGAVFGLVNAVVTVGIIVLSVSFFRFGPAILGHEPIMTSQGGSLVYHKSLWVPVDELTVKFYEHLSRGAFSTPNPLARRMPDLYEQAAMQRMVYTDTSDRGAFIARNTIKDDQFQVRGRYQIAGASLADLASFETVDAEGQVKRVRQDIKDSTTGDPISGNVRVEGFIVEFNAEAMEKSGQFVIGPGQARLVYTEDGEADAVHPFAIVATPEAGAGGMHRFPLNADDIFIPSVGGSSISYFAFEFVVPADAVVRDLIIKNYRVPVTGPVAEPGVSYRTAEARDQAIRDAELFSSFGINVGGLAEEEIDKSESITIAPTGRGDFAEMYHQSLIPEGWVVATTTGTKGLEVQQFDKEKKIVGGQGQFTVSDLKQKGLDRNLRVDSFATTRDTGILQVKVKAGGSATRLGQALEATTHDGPPRLLDDKNRVYDAVGWVYADGGTVNIRFTPGKPLQGLSELPSALSATKRDQTLYLIFRPTKGAKIEAFLLGKKQIALFQGGTIAN